MLEVRALHIVSAVIYGFVEFDSSVICHVPRSVVCLALFLLQKCMFIAEMYLFNYSLWRDKVGEHHC